MKLFTKLSIGAITTVTFASLFAGSAFAQTDYQINTTWTHQWDAKCFQIFYKEAGAPSWQFGVRCKDVNGSLSNYSIKGLKAGVSYTYQVKEIRNVDDGHKYKWLGIPTTLQSTPVPQW